MKAMLKIAIWVILLITFISCSKDRNYGSMTVKMTDAPAEFNHVYIELVEIRLHYSSSINDSENGWVSLDSNPGIYDLLELQNDVLATIADDPKIPVGHVNQLRLILGDENSVVIDGLRHDLSLSSQDINGLKLNLDTRIKNKEKVTIVLDFDAEQSIVQFNENEFKLKPVIKVESIN